MLLTNILSAAETAVPGHLVMTLEVDVDGTIETIRFTHSVDDNEDMTCQVQGWLLTHPNLEITPYVWTVPTEDQLSTFLQRVLKRLNISTYAERKMFTGEEIPAEIIAARAHAVGIYNTFKSALPNVPQDWDAQHYWIVG